MDSGLPLYKLQFSNLIDLLPQSSSPQIGIFQVVCEDTDQSPRISLIKSD